jgi:large subunit ribosomal protein L21
MKAIVESAGFQYPVQEKEKILVPRMEEEVGSEVVIDKVLLLIDGKKTLVGKPYVEGARVEAEVLSHGKSPKILVYKYKPKKNYRKKRGHRQHYTEILIKAIKK